MGKISLGRLEKVDLRSIWKDEAGDFTPWLAQAENLKILSECIGLDLELQTREKDVGPFRADILCKNTSDDTWVLIENQLNRTDHIHLGQLMTYAAGLQAATMIWIAERFTEEHRASLDWLNEITGDRFTFFGLEVELWKIGESSIAPKFNICSKPNDWSRTVKSNAKMMGEVSEHRQKQFQFWTSFKTYMEGKSEIRCSKPYPQHWMNHPIGRTGVHLSSIITLWDARNNVRCPEIRVELVCDDSSSKHYFQHLLEQKHEVEKELGPLNWHNPTDARMCRIFLRETGSFENEVEWPKLHEWLRLNLEKFDRVFRPRVNALVAPVIKNKN